MMEIATTTFERLVRDSEKLDIVKEYVKKKDYLCKEELSIILGIEVEK